MVSRVSGQLTCYKDTDTNPNFPPLEWWELNANALSKWSASFFFFLLQPSSAGAEWVFFLLKVSLESNRTSLYKITLRPLSCFDNSYYTHNVYYHLMSTT